MDMVDPLMTTHVALKEFQVSWMNVPNSLKITRGTLVDALVTLKEFLDSSMSVP